MESKYTENDKPPNGKTDGSTSGKLPSPAASSDTITGAIEKRKDKLNIASQVHDMLIETMIGNLNLDFSSLLDFLGINLGDDFSAIKTWDHPKLTDEQRFFPPDNLSALGFIMADALKNKKPGQKDNIIPRLDNTVVSVGSPTSDAFSRLVMGYEKNESNNIHGYLSLRDDAPFGAPFKWVLDEEGIDRLPREEQFILRRINGEWRSWPNWYITDDKGNSYMPVCNEKNMLRDFLLVTITPNYLVQYNKDSSSVITNFAGTHGEATRSIAKVFEKGIIKNIIDSAGIRRSGEGVQILIQIDFSDNKISSAQLIDSVKFGTNDTWEEAHRLIKNYIKGGAYGVTA